MKSWKDVLRWSVLLVVPFLLCLLFKSGFLDRAQDWAMDLRYQVRGELP